MTKSQIAENLLSITLEAENPHKIEGEAVNKLFDEIVEAAKELIAKNDKLELEVFAGCDDEHCPYGQLLVKKRDA